MDYVDYAILFGLFFIAVLLVILIVKSNQNHPKNIEKDIQGYFNEKLQKEFGNFKTDVQTLLGQNSKENNTDLAAFKSEMKAQIDAGLNVINQRVEMRLGQGFEKTNETVTKIVERIAKIDEAQKNIEKLSTEVVSLNSLLSDKQTRGVFGEVQLYQILEAVMGKNQALFEKQFTLSNHKIADALIHAPKPLGDIVIDSKFPLENYRRMMDKNLSKIEQNEALKQFENDVKKHINDIKNKYIILDETSDQAIMFVPAEAIFSELAAHHQNLMDYAHENHVWIASPTTLLSTLSMIQSIVKNIERDAQTSIILEELKKLGIEFERYTKRWTDLSSKINQLHEHAKGVDITSKKLSQRFNQIQETKFDQIDANESNTE